MYGKFGRKESMMERMIDIIVVYCLENFKMIWMFLFVYSNCIVCDYFESLKLGYKFLNCFCYYLVSDYFVLNVWYFNLFFFFKSLFLGSFC